MADADLRVDGFAHDVLLTLAINTTRGILLADRNAAHPLFGLSFGPYSPECVEAVFCEVRQTGARLKRSLKGVLIVSRRPGRGVQGW